MLLERCQDADSQEDGGENKNYKKDQDCYDYSSSCELQNVILLAVRSPRCLSPAETDPERLHFLRQERRRHLPKTPRCSAVQHQSRDHIQYRNCDHAITEKFVFFRNEYRDSNELDIFHHEHGNSDKLKRFRNRNGNDHLFFHTGKRRECLSEHLF
jgi:hypothetical protein